MLAVPEGKLVNSKGKRKVLEWLDGVISRSVVVDGCEGAIRKAAAIREEVKTYIVCDVDSDKRAFTLMKGEEVLEAVSTHASDDGLFERILQLYEESEDDVCVEVKGGKISGLSEV